MSLADITYWTMFAVAIAAVIIAGTAVIRGKYEPEPVIPPEPVESWDFPASPSIALFDQELEREWLAKGES
jgi:hypothetical protein